MKSGLKFFVVSLTVVGIAGGMARAIPVGPLLSISDGVDPTITIFDNFTGDLNPATGVLTMSTNIGVWSLSIATGVTKPNLGNAKSPVMDLVIQASSTNAGSLTYTFSDVGFTAFSSINTAISGHIISGAPATVNYNVYDDPSNLPGVLTSLLTSTGTNALPLLANTSGTLPSSGTYSLSQVVQVTASGATAVSIDASLSVIPEPSTVTLTFLGLTLFVVGLAYRRRSAHSLN